MEIILLLLVAGGLYVYHESTSGASGGPGGGGGINIAVNGSPGGMGTKAPPQQPKAGGGGSGGGFGLGGGGGGFGGSGGSKASGASDPISSFLDDRQDDRYSNDALKAQADSESSKLTPYEQQQLDTLNNEDYWSSGNQGPAPLADNGGATESDDLGFMDESGYEQDWGSDSE